MLGRRKKTARRFSRDLVGGDFDVAVSSRVRLARNLANHRFPDWAADKERDAIRRELEPVVLGLPAFAGGRSIVVSELDDSAIDGLVESHLISGDLADGGVGAGAVFAGDAPSADNALSVMFNEEDHIRIQAILPGFDLERAWKIADDTDTRIEASVRYAFDSNLGYITSCPSNLGTGLRASVMLHLPALRLAGYSDAIFRAFDALHIEIRGMGGEGSGIVGDLVQLSNQGTLGFDERHVIGMMTHVVEETIRQEINARIRMITEQPIVAVDFIARSLALLKNARTMGSDEALDLLSAMRVGIEWELLSGMEKKTVDELVRDVQPAHLAHLCGMPLDKPEERDAARAAMLNARFSRVKVRA